jgi:putative membrane protein
MADQPYLQYKPEELILRDYLAADRTALANERTLMSYVRTALAMMAAGASALHFLEGMYADVLGSVLVAAGVGALAVGTWRYRWFKRRIDGITAGSSPAR